MKNLTAIIVALVISLPAFSIGKDTTFKLFEKSVDYSGFGGVTFNMFQNKHFMVGGEGAAILGNYYLGGFGYSGSLGYYTYPFGSYAYKLTKSSGGILVGAMSNTKNIFSLYGDLKLSWDRYSSDPEEPDTSVQSIEYSGFSFLPTIGVALRPINFLQIRIGYGYNFSGLVDDGGLENVPYNAGQFTFGLTFGGF